jgi:acyl-CoA thioesterase-1
MHGALENTALHALLLLTVMSLPSPDPPLRAPPHVVLHAGDSMVGGPGGLARALASRFQPYGTKYVRDWRVATVQTFDYQNYFGKLVDDNKPDLVILNLGANDVFVPNPQSLARFVERIAKKATAGGRACFWITPPLWKPPDTGIVAVIKEHAAPCLVFDSSDLVLPKWPDGIHPNNEGGAIWAEKFWAFYEANRTR